MSPKSEQAPRVPGEPSGESGASSRRSFLLRLGLGATLLAVAGQIYAFLRSLVPNVLYEPARRFKVGPPGDFAEGARFIEERRVVVFRRQTTFHAISAVCTHLGCTVKLEQLERPRTVRAGSREIVEEVEFHCPCHGSKYRGDGTNYAGPAPRPLPHFLLEVAADDGQLVVDSSEVVDRDFKLTV